MQVASADATMKFGGAVRAPFDRVAAEGLAVHPHVASLAGDNGPSSARDLADMVHLVCTVYGNHPTMIEAALGHTRSGAQRDWMLKAADAFETERHYLVALTSCVGPMPSTPGAAQTTGVLQSQRHAVETLANSEREGCALGAAAALVLDWRTVRDLLDKVASRRGVECRPLALPEDAETAAALDSCENDATRRALGFGAEQLLLQHRGLFDLLEARAQARDKADG